mgnify:CR=1 FL=1
MPEPKMGDPVHVIAGDLTATIIQVIGYNPSYRAWIVRVDWNGQTRQMPITQSESDSWIEWVK